ncbi:MAG: DUF4105 domain-containing protein [Bdellovibrionales bacterium]
MRFLRHWLWALVLGGHGLTAWAQVPPLPADTELSEVARSPGWQRLIHYQRSWYGRLRSLADGRGFFFAPDGKTNPEAELRATWLGLGGEQPIGKLKQPPYCAFPERRRFLEERFKVQFPKRQCELFDKYMAMFNDPKAISLVFSSAYPNNPASMFGHTFLKIHASRQNDLLDSGLNYAAMVAKDEGGLAFAWRGIFGGYLGVWSTQPYYVKVNEYSHFESRDLWEYELNFSPQEVRRFLAHVWELETNTVFDYYFFDENCAYQILEVIAAIRPEWKILDYKISMIPGESVKNLAYEPGVIRQIKFRPSSYKKIHQRYAAMTKAERKEFFAIVDGHKPAEESRSRFVLDAVAAYYDYRRNEAKADYKKVYEQRREKLLSYRATLGVTTDEEIKRLPLIEADTQPELGHDTYTFATTGAWRGRESQDAGAIGLRLKAAYHDLLNKDLGFNHFSQLDFPWIEGQYDDLLKQFRLEELGVIAITSLPAITAIDKRYSWRMRTQLFTARDYGCDTCRHLSSEGGVGVSTLLRSGHLLAYTLAGAKVEFYSGLNRGYRLGPQVELGVLARLGDDYKATLSALQRWDLGQKERADYVTTLNFGHAYSLSRNRELRQTNLLHIPKDHPEWNFWESRLEMLFFFR